MGDDNGQNIVCAVVKFVCDVEGEGSECALVRPEELAVEPDGNEIIRAVEGEFIHGAGNFGLAWKCCGTTFMRIDCDQFLGSNQRSTPVKPALELRIAGNGDGLEGAVVEVRFLGPALMPASKSKEPMRQSLPSSSTSVADATRLGECGPGCVCR